MLSAYCTGPIFTSPRFFVTNFTEPEIHISDFATTMIPHLDSPQYNRECLKFPAVYFAFALLSGVLLGIHIDVRLSYNQPFDEPGRQPLVSLSRQLATEVKNVSSIGDSRSPASEEGNISIHDRLRSDTKFRQYQRTNQSISACLLVMDGKT